MPGGIAMSSFHGSPADTSVQERNLLQGTEQDDRCDAEGGEREVGHVRLRRLCASRIRVS